MSGGVWKVTFLVAALTALGGSAEPAPASATTATHMLTIELVQLLPNAASSSSLRTHESSTAGFGTVTSSPAGLDCGDTCSAQFADGTAVTLTATAAFGWFFGGWGGDYGDCSGHGACVLTIDRDRVVQAVFQYTAGPEPPTCHVPNLVGMLLRKAVVRIAHAHCRLGRVNRQRSSKARKNHVLAQSPGPGTSRIPGARINLTVGKGPTKR
jgi:hypothetical protein